MSLQKIFTKNERRRHLLKQNWMSSAFIHTCKYVWIR